MLFLHPVSELACGVVLLKRSHLDVLLLLLLLYAANEGVVDDLREERKRVL
jgi:hypothetical protein